MGGRSIHHNGWVWAVTAAWALLAACAQAADAVPLEDLYAKTESARIEALARLIDGATPPKHAEQLVAKMFEESWAGRHRARWCLAALLAISEHPEPYVAQYEAVAGWLPFEGPLPAADSPERVGPAIPEARAELDRKVWGQCIDRVIADLDNADGQRVAAAELALERMAAPPAVIVPRLALVLADTTRAGRLRGQAALVIGRYGRYAGSVAPLIGSLRDHEPRVRAACAVALGQLGQPYDLYGAGGEAPAHPDGVAAAKALLPVLTDPDPAVARGSMDSLRLLGPAAAPATEEVVAVFLGSEARYKDGLLAALAGWGSEAALPAFAQMLASQDVAARSYAAQKLAEYLERYAADGAALDRLAGALEAALAPRLADQPAVTGPTAVVCGILGPRVKRLRPALLKALEDPAQHSHLAAIFTAAMRIDPAAAPVDRLVQIAARRPAPAVREELAKALSAAGKLDEEGAAALVALVEDTDPQVRAAAVYGVLSGAKDGARLSAGVREAVERLVTAQDPVAVRVVQAAYRERKGP